jgi:phenol hydroxylase P5 protein
MLDACLRAGIWLPHVCCHGLCATCKVQLREGEIDHGDASPFALMDFERDEGKALACCATLESDTVIEVDLEEDLDAQLIPIKDFEAVVSKIVPLTPTIKAVFVQLDAPMYFKPGQYVNVTIPTLGLRRPFSPANPLSTGNEIELNVRQVPGGEGTRYLHEQLKAGDRLHLSGPYGRFFVRKSDLPLLFIAGGSGLSSPRSMILDLIENGSERPMTLVYGQRTRAELYYHEEFLELARRHCSFTYIPALSHEPADSPWPGYRGLAPDAARAAFNGDFRGLHAYLCGPPGMIEACIRTLMQGRLFEKDIYAEKFISAADAPATRSPLFRKL